MKAVAAACCFVALYVALDWVSFIQPLQATSYTPWNPPPALSLALLITKGLWFAPAVFAAELISSASRIAFPSRPFCFFRQRRSGCGRLHSHGSRVAPNSLDELQINPCGFSCGIPGDNDRRRLSRRVCGREDDRRAPSVADRARRLRDSEFLHRRSDRHHWPASGASCLEDGVGPVEGDPTRRAGGRSWHFPAKPRRRPSAGLRQCARKGASALLPDVAAGDLDRRAPRAGMVRDGDPHRSAGPHHDDRIVGFCFT